MRRLTLIVASALTVTTLAACGGEEEVTQPTATPTTSSSSTTSESTSDSSSSTESSSDSSSSTDSATDTSSSSGDSPSSSSTSASDGSFTPAASPDKEAILKVTKEFANALATNDMDKACELMTNSTSTKPMKDSPVELAACKKAFKEKMGGNDTTATQARKGYSIMTFDTTEQSGDKARTSIKAGGQAMTQKIGNARVDGTWYIDGAKPFITG